MGEILHRHRIGFGGEFVSRFCAECTRMSLWIVGHEIPSLRYPNIGVHEILADSGLAEEVVYLDYLASATDHLRAVQAS
jgi:hypothetical protein